MAAWAAASLALVALASAYDQTVSQTLADGASGWALWFQRFGEAPGYVAAGCGAAIVLGSTNPKPDGQAWDRQALAAVVGLYMVLGFTMGGVMAQMLLLDKLTFGGVVSGVFCSLVAAASVKLGEHGRANLRARLMPWRPLGLSLVMVAVYGGLTLTCLKELWGRARPYMVLPSECAPGPGGASCGAAWSPNNHCDDYVGDTDHTLYKCEFSGWWLPHGPRSGLTSFPSGHTFSGWASTQPIRTTLNSREVFESNGCENRYRCRWRCIGQSYRCRRTHWH